MHRERERASEHWFFDKIQFFYWSAQFLIFAHCQYVGPIHENKFQIRRMLDQNKSNEWDGPQCDQRVFNVEWYIYAKCIASIRKAFHGATKWREAVHSQLIQKQMRYCSTWWLCEPTDLFIAQFYFRPRIILNDFNVCVCVCGMDIACKSASFVAEPKKTNTKSNWELLGHKNHEVKLVTSLKNWRKWDLIYISSARIFFLA